MAAGFAFGQSIRAAGMTDGNMVCCMLLAIVLGPLGLWVMPSSRLNKDAACCANTARSTVAAIMILSGGLCLAAGLVLWSQPATFQHICRVLGRP